VSPETLLATQEGFSEAADRRKRLGQYFSGVGLARLLGALAGAERAGAIIDPMVGSGDMLAGCLALGAQPKDLGAIDIDPAARAVCAKRLPEAKCILGSAFSPTVLAELPRHEWDLVITNPPYVRYQSMAKGAGKHFKLPSAMEVRNGLLKALDGMTALDETDRALFKAIVSGYSGLADLAVPSWILCAAMVSVGGRLALVVPESWMSRDYASVVHYLLLRWFHIEYVVEDEHAAWFDDAQVKTTLLVARRVKRKDGAFGWRDDDIFVRARVSGKAAGPEGPIARLFLGKKKPEALFAAKAKKVLDSGAGFEEKFISAFPSSLGHVAESLKTACCKQKWFSAVGEKDTGQAGACFPPHALAEWVRAAANRSFVSLESLGVSIGQGLRTGANSFFYATHRSNDGTEALISLNGIPGIREVKIPLACLRPVVRRQSELPEGFVIHATGLAGRVLDLRTTALPEDIKTGGSAARKAYASMPKELAAFVRKAARADFGMDGKPRRLHELSAVSPNVRKGNSAKGIAPRFWYMLPDFTPRHQPDLIMPRVNGETPKAWLVADRSVLVDANFATLRVNESGLDVYALLALLNSTWCRAALEYGASVMGGGALKVEAAHLRRLPIPKLSAAEWHRLATLGRCLADGSKGIEDVDRLVVSALLGRSANKQEREALSQLAEDGRTRRKNHKKTKEPK
jgi:hypothetical protein